jgi:hypothetical protein
MMGPYVAAKNLVRKRITLTPVTGGGANPTKSASPLLISLLLSASVHAQQTPGPADTGKAGPKRPRMAGLAIVDSGKYAESSEAAAQSFQAAVPKDEWQSLLGQTCGPLG